jgi:hypothetical protein
VLCTSDSAADVKTDAAMRVVRAAELFGDTQADSAKAWVAEALAGKHDDTSELLEQQSALFEECIIGDDDGAKCKELDLALAGLEEHLNAGRKDLADKKTDRAAARVRIAASRFGESHAAVAEAWVADAIASGAANPTLLLQTQFALFDECLIDEDGSSARCFELQEALSAFQAGLGVGGRVVSTRGFMPIPSDGANDGPAPPNGFQWGPTF